MIAIDDAALPALAQLNEELLDAITGARSVEILRLRYRPGRRAILHVSASGRELGDQSRREGVIWFLRGDEGRRIARRNASALYHDATKAVFEEFPQDHRLPEIRAFLENFRRIGPAQLGADPGHAPVPVRYRPGESCTFRCRALAGGELYVKLVGDDSPARLLAANRELAEELGNGSLRVAHAVGTALEVRAIAYEAAAGVPLDRLLAAGSEVASIQQVIDGLDRFNRLPVAPPRRLTPDVLLKRAQDSADFVAAMYPALAAQVRRLVAELEATQPQTPCRPIHGDMKLEHLFSDGKHLTMIDTESMALGPPDYDLAKLYGALALLAGSGSGPGVAARTAACLVAEASGPAFDWCRTVVAVRLAKTCAGQPGPDTEARVARQLALA